MNDAPLVVCFRFLAVDDLLVPQFDISIPLKHLKALPESLLSKRCEWNSTAARANPTSHQSYILVHPSNDPYKRVWCHDMGKLIVDAYDFHFNKKESVDGAGSESQQPAVPFLLKLTLPAGMDLEVALMVLDYYGLTIENPRSEVSLENSQELIQIRAVLFMTHMDLLHGIKDFIINKLKTSPRRINYFVHSHHGDDLALLNATQNARNLQSTFFRLGNDENFANFKEVLDEPSMQNNLVGVLGDVGIKAQFMEGCLNNDDLPAALGGWSIRHYGGKCWVATEPVPGELDPETFSAMAFYGGKYEIGLRYVLRVEIPRG
jgi:hypothetical protein